jgi:hypothetical protein
MFEDVGKKNPPVLGAGIEADLDRLKTKFRLVLNAKLLKNYGCVPTSKKFADDFNHAAAHQFTISNETARKWIGGVVLPSGPRLQILSQWLGISLQGALEQNEHEFKKTIRLTELQAIIENLSPNRLNILLEIAREFISHERKNSKT